ncbi:hypothetical protein INS49_014493 [Diaporthe citri]|uniref:uncharacterized protein n=1 Tax=Diaporthe citri TaxID=83186 RepID=UPI001C80402D|nr:uncharacterized protein INS49_014493 [Diaporthe citri]KAG6356619.1 hypothetical protein INS49_014493 [Diaporthe citri]
MAKTRGKAPSIHSRAARRATSPSINTDKSLKDARPPPESVDARPSVLGLHQNAGVTKKSKRGRKAVLSTRARKRHERGLERAEEIVDRTSNKVLKSKKAAANIAGRKKGWDDINAQAGEAAGARLAGVNKFAGLADGDDDEDFEEVDEEMWEAEQGTPAVAAVLSSTAALDGAPPPPLQGEDEEIL